MTEDLNIDDMLFDELLSAEAMLFAAASRYTAEYLTPGTFAPMGENLGDIGHVLYSAAGRYHEASDRWSAQHVCGSCDGHEQS